MFLDRLNLLTSSLEQQEVLYGKKQLLLDEGLEKFSLMLNEAVTKQGIVYVIGNGGSCGIASHFSNDLLKALKIPSHTLTDTNVLTCFSNDYGYEHVYSGPLSTLLKPSDLLVAISSSGCSENILKAAEVASHKGAEVITLSGFSSKNPLREQGKLNFWINQSDYGLVEMAHFFILHTIIDTFHLCQKKFALSTHS